MDGRIVGITENLVRKIYKLSDSYESTQCNVKSKCVEIFMTNSVLDIKVKIPMYLIEDAIMSGESAVCKEIDLEDSISKDKDKECNKSNDNSEEQIGTNTEHIEATKKKVKVKSIKNRIKDKTK